LQDVARTRREPKALLTAGRGALQAGDPDRAEHLAAAADKLASAFTFPVWGDTPGKLRKDAQAARAKAGTVGRAGPGAERTGQGPKRETQGRESEGGPPAPALDPPPSAPGGRRP